MIQPKITALRLLRYALGLSLKEASLKTLIDQDTIARIESNFPDDPFGALHLVDALNIARVDHVGPIPLSYFERIRAEVLNDISRSIVDKANKGETLTINERAALELIK